MKVCYTRCNNPNCKSCKAEKELLESIAPSTTVAPSDNSDDNSNSDKNANSMSAYLAKTYPDMIVREAIINAIFGYILANKDYSLDRLAEDCKVLIGCNRSEFQLAVKRYINSINCL